ncbi:MAG: hypothetical protein J0I26_05280 [Alphaproteobacteria bacterium]|nr:hypothetical protein [Alphaproteobacteria bacterium]
MSRALGLSSEDVVAAYDGDPEGWTRFAWVGGGGGHPQLIDVVVTGLASRGWPAEAMEQWLEDGFRSDDVEAERDATRRRLLAELSDRALQFLYCATRIADSIADYPTQRYSIRRARHQCGAISIEVEDAELYLSVISERAFQRGLLGTAAIRHYKEGRSCGPISEASMDVDEEARAFEVNGGCRSRL